MTRTSRHFEPAFAVLLALLSTAIGYRFGTGNQFEQLPIILRQLDPSYLIADPFVSSSAEFGPRYYFARMVVGLCHLVPLEWAYALLRFASDLALVAVTMWAAPRVIGADRLGARMAAVLTVAVSAIHLGDAAELRYAVFQPASLAIPGMLLAIALGMLGRPIAAGVVASISSLPHPLLGAYGGGIGLGTSLLALLAAHRSRGAGRAWRAAGLRTAAGAAIFGASLVAFWWWPSQAPSSSPLSTKELLAILGRFRSPHHYLPSHFRPVDFVTLAVFIAAGWVAFERWHASAPPWRAWLVTAPLAVVVAGCVAGTLFIEIWPVRIVVTLQLFRLLGVLKWIGFLLFGWLLASYWHRPPGPLARPVVALSLLSAGGAFPLVTAAGVSLVRFRSSLPAAVPAFVWLVALTIAAAALSAVAGPPIERVRLFAAVGLLAAFASGSGRLRLAAGVVAILVVVGVTSNRPVGPAPVTSPFQVTFSFDDLHDVRAETARAAGRGTSRDALFVAPPDFGILRLVGQRALVVDFEAVPFQEQQMRAWRERIRDVYGEVGGGGLAARTALDREYREITDAHLETLASRYGVTHAVLYAETATKFPVLYSNNTYRVVRLAR